MIDLNKAINYVQLNGNQIEQARLNTILSGKSPSQSILEDIAEMQNSDGGFSYKVKNLSTVYETVNVLIWLDDLSIHNETIIEHAFNFLLQHQEEDGGWNEIKMPNQQTLTHNLIFKTYNNRVWLTSFCAHWFVRFGNAEPQGAKGCPVKFLLAHRDSSGRLLGPISATWNALVLFSYHPGTESEIFKQTLKVIEKDFDPNICKDSNLAQLICCLRDAKLSGDHNFVKYCLKILAEKQLPDGSWESENRKELSTNATIEALRITKHYELI